MPSDDITVFYKASGNLAHVIPKYYEFIYATIKQPLQAFTTSPPTGPGVSHIVSDNAKVISPSSCRCCLFFHIFHLNPFIQLIFCHSEACFTEADNACHIYGKLIGIINSLWTCSDVK